MQLIQAWVGGKACSVCFNGMSMFIRVQQLCLWPCNDILNNIMCQTKWSCIYVNWVEIPLCDMKFHSCHTVYSFAIIDYVRICCKERLFVLVKGVQTAVKGQIKHVMENPALPNISVTVICIFIVSGRVDICLLNDINIPEISEIY